MDFDVIGWSKIDKTKTDIDAWKKDWTAQRASKLDAIDTKITKTNINEINANVNSIATTLNEISVPTGDMVYLKALNLPDGIQLTYETSVGASYDGVGIANNDDGSKILAVKTGGVMIRYSKTKFPETITEGTLVVNDADVLGQDAVTSAVISKRKKYKITDSFTNGDVCYISCFPYSEDGVYNMQMGTRNCLKVTYNFSPKTFSASSWSEIGEIAESGAASSFYHVGDEKDITLTTGETLTFQIYDFNHDDLESGGKAGITLGMKNLMRDYKTMNSSNTNVGGYKGSAMFKIMEQIYSQLPLEVQQIIKPVKKKTSEGNLVSTIHTDIVKTFLFSENEVFGEVAYSFDGEGMQYPIFTTDQSRVKKMNNGSGGADSWWLRSPICDDADLFCFVYDDGTAYGGCASVSFGVCFGFCI